MRMTIITGKSRVSHPGSFWPHIVCARRNTLGSRAIGLLLLLLYVQNIDLLIGFGRPHLSAKMWVLIFEFPIYSFLIVSWTILVFNGKKKKKKVICQTKEGRLTVWREKKKKDKKEREKKKKESKKPHVCIFTSYLHYSNLKWENKKWKKWPV